MFSIDVNAISKKNRFTIPPLGPIGKSTGFLESTLDTDVSVKSLSSVSDNVGDTSEGALSDHELPDLWTAKPDHGIAQNLTFSWDAPLRGPATRGAFLSEQPARVFVASRYHVQPRLESASTTTRRFISPSDLLTSLRTTLLGGTSLLFGWDEANARFVVRSEKSEDDSENIVLILGELSEETTMSLVEPLLCIGGLLRRLDGIVAKLQSSSAIPTARALAYALQSIIELIQTDLTARLPLNLAIIALARLSVIFNDIRCELDALAELCLCPIDEFPPFKKLPTTQAKLLDHLLLALDHAFKHSAPHRIPAMLTYLLTVSSQEFNNLLAITVGLAPESFHPSKTLVGGDRILLPSFFSTQSRSVLENAARALDILQRADPGHPLCEKELWAWEGPNWGWTDKDLQKIDSRTRNHIKVVRRALNIWYDSADKTASAAESDNDSLSADGDTLDTTLVPKASEAAAPPIRAYKPEIQAAFSIFDQPPGSHIASAAKDTSNSQLINKGPTSLPFSAPILPLTLESTLLALPLAHSRLVSSALLRVFTNRLAFKTHLKVVRGFLLGGDQVFWSRLRGALFEESGISNVRAAVGRGIRAGIRVQLGIVDPVRDQIADERAEREGRPREWGVGLAVGLSERGGPGTWPPGGAELGLRLRHVIDDALEVGWGASLAAESDDEGSEVVERDQDETVLKETSWRLGFVLRDLEEESDEGRARWLNPNAIEALDFLCLDYKPPDPIDVILTSDVRQKMHRVFTFLLRLLRVETVTKMLFNTIFQSASDYPPVVLLARFRIQSFVSSLVGYVTDTAIGANWNTFLAALDEIERDDEGSDEPTPRRDPKKGQLASDIFTVHAHLSATVDRMLEACLLRARQRGVGNALKECMEAVLVLGKLVGDWCREQTSNVQESQTKRKFFTLNVTKVLQRFDKLHIALITALRALDVKGTAAGGSNISSEDAQLLRRHEGETESAYGQMATWLDPIGRCIRPKAAA